METRRMCPQCRAFITTNDRVCPYCNEPVGPRAVERDQGGTFLGGLIPQARFITMIILVINFGLYIATAIYSMRRGEGGGAMNIDGRTLFDFGAKYPPAIREGGQWWRLVTAGFLHGGLLHILMNSWALYDLIAEVEGFYGTSRLIVAYVFTTFTGFLVSLLWRPMTLSVGASAACFGLIGIMLAIGI